MSILEQYLHKLFGSLTKKDEREEPKKYREQHGYIYLYHGTPNKNYASIKQYGLDPQREGESKGSPTEHPSGKKSISYSTHKAYSMAYGGLFDKITNPLIVKVPNRELFFAIRDTGTNIDEYRSPLKIKPRDIIFPDDNDTYTEIENKCSYLIKKKNI